MTSTEYGHYEQLAREYYDRSRHPTCANLRDASSIFIDRALSTELLRAANIWEVGAGKSVVAELMQEHGLSLAKLVLVDTSPGMLSYSRALAKAGAELILADASALPTTARSVDAVVSSLGDSYNNRSLLREVHRVLRNKGLFVYSTPSYEWARAFRPEKQGEPFTAAGFDLSDGSRILLPSFIYPVSEQTEMLRACGLTVKTVSHVTFRDLHKQKISPRLCLSRGPDAGVVTGFCATRS